jgi:hypothetical protein
MMREVIHAENKGVVIPSKSEGLRTREWRQSGEISASSLVFVVKGGKVTRRLVKEVIKVAGV